MWCRDGSMQQVDPSSALVLPPPDFSLRAPRPAPQLQSFLPRPPLLPPREPPLLGAVKQEPGAARKYECSVCCFNYKDSYKLRIHMARKHDSEPFCKKCKKFFNSHAEVNLHLLHCKSSLTVVCEFCELEYSNSTTLRRHMATVHQTEPFCKKCQKYFGVFLEFQAHSQVCTQNHKSLHKQSLGCCVCNKQFSSGYHLRRHMAGVHNAEPFCKKCRKCFESFPELQMHAETCRKGHTYCRNSSPPVQVKVEVP